MKLSCIVLLLGIVGTMHTLHAQTGSIWGVNGAKTVWQWDGSQWIMRPGTMTQVSVTPDGDAYALDANGAVSHWNGSAWQSIESPSQRLVRISAGRATDIWGIDELNNVHRFDGHQWKAIPEKMQEVSVAADGSVWGLDLAAGSAGGDVHFWNGVFWQKISGQLRTISAASATDVWGVNSANQVWHWDGATWELIAGSMKQVSVSADGSVWGIDLDRSVHGGRVHYWTGSAWRLFSGNLAQVTATSIRTEENKPALRFQGSWARRTSATASGGSYMASAVPANSMTYSFTGNSIAIYRRLDGAGGLASVTIDGNKVGNLSFFACAEASGNGTCTKGDERSQVPAVFDNLGAGPHTLVLTISAEKPSQSNWTSTGTNAYIDFVVAPWPFLPTSDQKTALDRLNQYRGKIGVPLARFSSPINLAAQGHAEYLNLNPDQKNLDTHVEYYGKPGYFGFNYPDRMNYFGYDRGQTEDVTLFAEPVEAVDRWMETVYHRFPLLAFPYNEAGFGTAPNGAVMNFGTTNGINPAERILIAYPVDGQIAVPFRWTNAESPDPIPGATYPVGYPITLSVVQPANAQTGTALSVAPSSRLVDSKGTRVDVYLVDSRNPARDYAAGLAKDKFALVPKKPLKLGEKYTATITGTDTNGSGFTKTWSFTTVMPPQFTNGFAYEITRTGAYVFWVIEGPATSVWVEYGPTAQYGSRVDPTTAVAQLTGLTPNTVYHYRIHCRDAATGRSAVTGDLTFKTLP